MKKSWKIVLGIVGVLILLSVFNNIKSCSIKNEKESKMNFKPTLSTKEIECSNPLINGELGNYLQVKELKATINFSGIEELFIDDKFTQKWEAKVCITRNSKPLPFDLENISGNSGLYLQLLNSSSSPVSNLNEISGGIDNNINELLSLKAGESKWFTFTFEYGESQKEDVIKDITFFILNSKIDFVEESTTTSNGISDDEKPDTDMKDIEKATELMERQVDMLDKVNKMSKEN
jgi:hypothetical protein